MFMEKKITQMLTFKKIFFAIVLLFLTSSCAINCYSVASNNDKPESIGDILPRASFVKVEKSVKLVICEVDPQKLSQCQDRIVGSSASGFVVKKDDDGAYIVTAAHVCDDGELNAFLKKTKNAEVEKKRFNVIDIDKNKYNFSTIAYDKEIDVCVGYVYNMQKPTIKFADSRPEAGDIIYNLAAPIGIFGENAVPIMNGHFVGITGDVALYSVPAAGGSSGSPLLNSKGELVGMIHSVYLRFPLITLSPTYKQLINFINNNADKEAYAAETFLKSLLP
jgi:S1-C subfamily serine protease